MELKRDIDPTYYAEVSKPFFYPSAMVYLDLPDGPLRVHSGIGDLSFDGQTWLGLGGIGGIQIPPEDGGAVPEEAVLTLTGHVADLIALADDKQLRGRQADIYSATVTVPGGNVLVGLPNRARTGSLGKSDFVLSEDRITAVFSVRVKSGQPPRSAAQIMHSDEEHQARFANDTLFRRVTNAAKWANNPPIWPAR